MSLKIKKLLSIVAASLTFVLMGSNVASSANEEDLNCKNISFERLYGNNEGCLMEVSDAAYFIGPIPINPSVTRCFQSDRDSVSYVRFPEIPKTGQLDGKGVTPFEISYMADCLTWKDAISAEAFVTDVNNQKISLGSLAKVSRSTKCSIYSECWPGYFTVIEFSGQLDVSKLTTKGYYKFSISFSRSFEHATALEKYYMNEPLTPLLEYSNQLWLGERIKAAVQVPSSSPIVADCEAEKTIQLPSANKSVITVSSKEKTQIKSFLRGKPKQCSNGEQLQRVICYGNYTSTKTKARANSKAKAFCSYVQKLYPDVPVWHEVDFLSPIAKGDLTIALEAYYARSK